MPELKHYPLQDAFIRGMLRSRRPLTLTPDVNPYLAPYLDPEEAIHYGLGETLRYLTEPLLPKLGAPTVAEKLEALVLEPQIPPTATPREMLPVLERTGRAQAYVRGVARTLCDLLEPNRFSLGVSAVPF